MENNTNDKLLTVLIKDPKTAANAYDFLVNKGFDKNDITVVMSDEVRKSHFLSELPENSVGSATLEGSGTGGIIGGAIGAIAAALAAVGTVLTIPALGLVIAGPIAAGLAGAGAGGAVGTLVGALTGAGYSDETAKQYEDEIKAGGILLGVHVPESRYTELQNEFNKFKA